MSYVLGYIVGAIIGLPVGALISAFFLWLACKILKDERPYLETFKAALLLLGTMLVVSIPFRFIDNPWVSLVQVVLGAAIGAGIYANVLGMEPGKAFLAWLIQQGMAIALCLMIMVPIVLAAGGMSIIASRTTGSKQVAAQSEVEEPEEAEDAKPQAAAKPKPEAPPAEEPMPQSESAPESQPEPQADSVPQPTPTPEVPTTSDSPPPTPEPMPTPVVVAPPEPTFPPGFQGDAQRAFHEGRPRDANDFLRAALLTSDEKTLWDNVRWCSALDRPVMGLRFGVGLQMAQPPPVVRRDGQSPPGDAAQGDPQAAGGDGNEGQPVANDGLGELRKFTGEIGPSVMEVFPKTGLGTLLGSMSDGSNMPKPVHFIGVGTDPRAALSLAEKNGLDVVLIANVSFKIYGVNRTVDANLAMRLMDVATEKRLWSSKTLSSNQVKAALQRGQDPVKDLVRTLTEYVETHFHLQDRPALDAAKIRQRAEAMTREETVNPLPALLELRYYQRKGLLTGLQAEQAYQRVLDAASAPVMASGDPDAPESDRAVFAAALAVRCARTKAACETASAVRRCEIAGACRWTFNPLAVSQPPRLSSPPAPLPRAQTSPRTRSTICDAVGSGRPERRGSAHWEARCGPAPRETSAACDRRRRRCETRRACKSRSSFPRAGRWPCPGSACGRTCGGHRIPSAPGRCARRSRPSCRAAPRGSRVPARRVRLVL